MKAHCTTTDFDSQYLRNLQMERPHVALLGAGASRAACPTGDKRGRKLPLMTDIVDFLDLEPLLSSAGISEPRSNFESLYSALVTNPGHAELVSQIEQRIFDYFASLELPDKPTLYDHLVLSFRSKDIIATFNWDPFLWQAIVRNHRVGPLPHTVFLHGNVAIGYCMEHLPIACGPRRRLCHICGQSFQSSRLLYPVTQKSYQSDPFIAKNWTWLKQELEAGFMLSVFGYSAPTTDVEAVELLRTGWGADDTIHYKTVEVIDIRPEDELNATWRPFVQSHYCDCVTDFYESSIGKYPRRSCESIFSAQVDCESIAAKQVPLDATCDELHAWFAPIVEAELSKSKR